jgi:SAM-dependent methyltransferase
VGGVTGRRVLVFGSYDADLHPRVAVLRDGLAARGWQVDELNAPLGASTADKVSAASSPRAAAALARRQAAAWRRLVAGARGQGDPDVVIVGYLGHADVHLARLLFRRSTIVLDHLVGLADTISDRELGGGMTVRALGAVDRAALAAADLVVVDTPHQAAHLPERARTKAVVVPVGAGDEWFAAAAAASGEPEGPLRVVFFGLYTPLQGAPVIGRALDLLRDEPIEFTMIGHGQDLAATRAAAGDSPRVRWIDWVAPAALPALVAGHDVCLGIVGTAAKAQRVVPTKVYQGMAAGCAVVTGDTPAAAALGDAVLRVPVGDADALAATLRDLHTDKELLLMARRRAQRGASSVTPAAVTAALDARLSAGGPGAAPPPLTFNAWLRWDLISSELAATGGRDVLEIGPGEGAAACRIAPGRRYTGVELSPRTRAITEGRLAAQGTPGRLLGSMDELDADEVFDLVCAFEVIEHIEDDRTALAQWVARVRPGGTLLLSTPAGPDRMGPADTIAGHFRRYSADGLADLAAECGLADVRVVHVGYPFGYALEAVRNSVARRRLAGREEPAMSVADVAEMTEGSSSFLQPPTWSGRLTRMASVPMRWAQRRRPDRGTGLVLIGRAPDGAPAQSSEDEPASEGDAG